MTREEAINQLECIYTEVSTEEDREAIDKAIEALKEPKQGEWIDTGYGTSRCSVCGEKCQTYCMDKPRDRYCLWCGASMSANDRQVIGKLDENTQKHYGFRKKY